VAPVGESEKAGNISESFSNSEKECFKRTIRQQGQSARGQERGHLVNEIHQKGLTWSPLNRSVDSGGTFATTGQALLKPSHQRMKGKGGKHPPERGRGVLAQLKASSRIK